MNPLERAVDKAAYFDQVTGKLEGWLERFTAERTMDLLDYQDQIGVTGPLYEVGIYGGKYLSTLLRSAMLNKQLLLGIDCFNAIPRAVFEDNFYNVTGRDQLTDPDNFQFKILDGMSTNWDGSDLVAEMGGRSRFVSVDASHDYEDVLWDLIAAERALLPGGIISADDFINPTCLGTNQAVNHFLATVSNVSPFAYISGKLFICRPAFADRYRAEVERGTLADEVSPKSDVFRKTLKGGYRFACETRFHGMLTLQIP